MFEMLISFQQSLYIKKIALMADNIVMNLIFQLSVPVDGTH